MGITVDYVMAPHSPWTYLGHARFVQMTQAAGATVRLRPVDMRAVFAASGGLPLHQRAEQRQAYRLLELARWRDALGLPMHVQPKHFPVSPDVAAKLLIVVDQADGTDAALQLAGTLLRAVWADERDLADPATLAQALADHGLPTAARLQAADAPEVQATYARYTQDALDAGVFGAPSFIVGGELFWGQDRLDFLQQRLQLAAAS